MSISRPGLATVTSPSNVRFAAARAADSRRSSRMWVRIRFLAPPRAAACGLCGGQVDGHFRLAGTPCRFAQERVSFAYQWHEVVRDAAVAGIHEPGAATRRGRDAERERVRDVRDARGLDAQIADREGPRRQCFPGQIRQEVGVRLVRAHASAELSRSVERGPVAAIDVLDPMTQRDQVHVVIGVHVADEHGRDLTERRVAPRFGERARAQVEDDARRTVLDQVAARGASGTNRVRRRTTDDGQLHRHHSSMRSTSSVRESTTSAPAGTSPPPITPHGPRRIQTGRIPAAAEGRTSLSNRSPT